MSNTASPPHSIAEYRSDYEEGRRLRGFRCSCGFTTATWVLVCPRCGRRDLSETDLSGRGRVAAFSVQTVPSDEFLNEAPYAYVIVDLEEGGRITGWMDGITSDRDLAMGAEVEWSPTYKPGVHFRRREASGPPAKEG
jgi:uncharacterized OB-fold protein